MRFVRIICNFNPLNGHYLYPPFFFPIPGLKSVHDFRRKRDFRDFLLFFFTQKISRNHSWLKSALSIVSSRLILMPLDYFIYTDHRNNWYALQKHTVNLFQKKITEQNCSLLDKSGTQPKLTENRSLKCLSYLVFLINITVTLILSLTLAK